MLVYIRGAGVIASAVAVRLFHANCRIVMSDLEHPRALCRTVCFSEALRLGKTEVSGITAQAARDPEEAVRVLRNGKIAVLADPDGNMRGTLPFDACIDTIRDGQRTDTSLQDAPIVIGIGERFQPGKNCLASVIAERDGYRGQVRYEGTDLPQDLPSGSDSRRFVRLTTEEAGLFYPVCEIGDPVRSGDTVAVVDSEPVICPESGILCGILAEGTPVTSGRPCAILDKQNRKTDLYTIPEEALSVGGGVLEALLHFREIY